MGKDVSLLELSRYIAVLNPVRGGAKAAKDWSWSSYRVTGGLVARLEWLTIDWISGGFGDNKQLAQLGFRQFVSEDKGQPSPPGS